MGTTRCLALFLCVGLSLAACAPADEPPPATAASMAPAPALTESLPTSATAPDSTGADLLKNLPKCAGIEVLAAPVAFDWPNIQERLQELSGGLWGYYSCDGPQAQVAAFYREQMPRPPTNMPETNWVARAEGTVGVYYNGSSLTWIYLWVVAQPGNPQKSYVIVAETADPVSGECRLERPEWRSEMAAGEWEGSIT